MRYKVGSEHCDRVPDDKTKEPSTLAVGLDQGGYHRYTIIARCRRWESNPHSRRNASLSRARLPFRHFGAPEV